MIGVISSRQSIFPGPGRSRGKTMWMENLAEPLYRIDHGSSNDVVVRLVRIRVENQQYVAFFTKEEYASEWVKENSMPDESLKPTAITTKKELTALLNAIAITGDKHVTINPRSGKKSLLVKIEQFIQNMG
jgi:hypothetical protein